MAGSWLSIGDINFDEFQSGTTTWTTGNSAITIPKSGLYEITFSATHHPKPSGNKKFNVQLRTNGAYKGQAYGYMNTNEAEIFYRDVSRHWLVAFAKEDQISLYNVYSGSVVSNSNEPMFLKLQHVF